MLRTTLILVVVLAATCSLRDQIAEVTHRGMERVPHKLGNVIYHKEHAHDDTETILLKTANPQEDPDAYEALMSNVLHFTTVNKTKEVLSCSKGKKSEFFKFGAEEVGVIGNKSKDTETVTLKRFDDDCFGQVSVSFRRIQRNAVNSV